MTLTREKVLTDGMTDAQKRLWRFADSVERGETPNGDDLDQVAVAFKRILGGVDPKKALGLSGRQSEGRHKRDNKNRWKKEVLPAIRIAKLVRYEGMRIQEAQAEISKQMVESGELKTNREEDNFVHDSVDRYWSRHRDFAAKWLDSEETFERIREDFKALATRLEDLGIDCAASDDLSNMSLTQLSALVDEIERMDDKERGAIIKLFSDTP